jgi:hypothetical protein
VLHGLLAFTETRYQSLYSRSDDDPSTVRIKWKCRPLLHKLPQSLNHIQITYTTLQTHFDIFRTVYNFQSEILSKQTNLSALLSKRKTPFHCLSCSTTAALCWGITEHETTATRAVIHEHMLQSPVTVHKISVGYGRGRLVRCKAWLEFVQGVGFKYDV